MPARLCLRAVSSCAFWWGVVELRLQASFPAAGLISALHSRWQRSCTTCCAPLRLAALWRRPAMTTSTLTSVACKQVRVRMRPVWLPAPRLCSCLLAAPGARPLPSCELGCRSASSPHHGTLHAADSHATLCSSALAAGLPGGALPVLPRPQVPAGEQHAGICTGCFRPGPLDHVLMPA